MSIQAQVFIDKYSIYSFMQKIVNRHNWQKQLSKIFSGKVSQILKLFFEGILNWMQSLRNFGPVQQYSDQLSFPKNKQKLKNSYQITYFTIDKESIDNNLADFSDSAEEKYPKHQINGRNEMEYLLCDAADQNEQLRQQVARLEGLLAQALQQINILKEERERLKDYQNLTGPYDKRRRYSI